MVVLPGSGRAPPSILTLNVSSVRAHRLLPSSAGVIGSRPPRMATTALNPAVNIPSRGSERFAAGPTAVGGPAPMSGRRAGHSSTAPERRSRTASGNACPAPAINWSSLPGLRRFGRAPARGPQRSARTAREPAGARRRNIMSFPRRDETRSRGAGLRSWQWGFGQVRRDEDGTRHRELLPPVRLLWAELRQAGGQFPGLDCKKPYRGKNSSGVTVCHDPLLGPAARDTADRLFLWGHPPPTLRAVRLQPLHRRAPAWTRSCRLPAHR